MGAVQKIVLGLLLAGAYLAGSPALAEPAGEGTLEELTSEAALAQLEAQRSDSPRATSSSSA